MNVPHENETERTASITNAYFLIHLANGQARFNIKQI
jgi:hypothetical protein